MKDNHVIQIQGKPYMTVAGRVQLAQETLENLSIRTELVETNDYWIMFKATVSFCGENGIEQVYTGYATSTFKKGGMEAKSPVEVAETSAVGRALGFAGIGILDGIATADEVHEAVERGEYIPVPDSPNYKELYSQVVAAKSIEDINNVTQSDNFKSLKVEEKMKLQSRIGKQFLNFNK